MALTCIDPRFQAPVFNYLTLVWVGQEILEEPNKRPPGNSSGVSISPAMVEDTISNPDKTLPDPVSSGRTIAQRRISDRHVLRVVFRREGNVAIIITFYPGRRSRYETAV